LTPSSFQWPPRRPAASCPHHAMSKMSYDPTVLLAVLEDLYRLGVCRGTQGVIEARGTMPLSTRVSVPRAVLRSSSTSIGPYKSSESTILQCSHTKRDGAQFAGSATGPDLYLLGRVYSIPGIRPLHTGLPGQAFYTACWDYWIWELLPLLVSAHPLRAYSSFFGRLSGYGADFSDRSERVRTSTDR
jgi:hypothetical protein